MDDRAENAGRPILADVFQPWEAKGGSRRDCAPHRARLLTAMARWSLIAAGLSFLGLPANVIGLPLGWTAWRMACRDRDRICAGNMDQEGYHPTEQARSDSRAALVLNLLSVPTALCGGVILLLLAIGV